MLAADKEMFLSVFKHEPALDFQYDTVGEHKVWNVFLVFSPNVGDRIWLILEINFVLDQNKGSVILRV
jgi:hypothetical protein